MKKIALALMFIILFLVGCEQDVVIFRAEDIERDVLVSADYFNSICICYYPSLGWVVKADYDNLAFRSGYKPTFNEAFGEVCDKVHRYTDCMEAG